MKYIDHYYSQSEEAFVNFTSRQLASGPFPIQPNKFLRNQNQNNVWLA